MAIILSYRGHEKICYNVSVICHFVTCAALPRLTGRTVPGVNLDAEQEGFDASELQ